MTLKDYLTKKGITQKQFAELLKNKGIKAHYMHVNKVACGRTRPSVKLALAIQTLTGGKVKACKLLFGE